MIWIFPMGGYGKRSSSLGPYKPFIQFNGRYIFQRCLDSLPIKSGDILMFCLSNKTSLEHIHGRYLREYCETEFKGKVTYHINFLDKVEPGPASTIHESLLNFSNTIDAFDSYADVPVTIVNIDQEVQFESRELNTDEAALAIWFNNNGKSCYVNLNKNFTEIIDIKEKEFISSYASSGVYQFGSLRYLVKCLNWGMLNKSIWRSNSSVGYENVYDELFVGPCMKYMLSIDKKIYPLKTYKKIDLGSSDEILKQRNYEHRNR